MHPINHQISWLFLILFSIGHASYSQISKKVDSTCVHLIQSLNPKFSEKYSGIYNQSQRYNFHKRLDSLRYDLAFIELEKNEHDSTLYVYETYYVTNDSLPSYFYLNGTRSSFKLIQGSRVQNDKITGYASLKKIQTATYNRKQYYGTGCVLVRKRDHARRKFYHDLVKKRIENNYLVKIAIRKTQQEVYTSIINPPENIKFKLILVPSGI